MPVGLEAASSAKRQKKFYNVGYHQAQNKIHLKISRTGIGQEHK